MSLNNEHPTVVDQPDQNSRRANHSPLPAQTTALPFSNASHEQIRDGKQSVQDGEHAHFEGQNAFLEIPTFLPPRRPSVQSTYSDFSELSYHPSHQHVPLVRTESSASEYGPPRSRFMRKLHSIWVTNYGALLVLCSQLFGCLMNLSTRLLETPGEHGEAMHPFQILFARQGITATVCITYGLYTKSIPHFPLGPKGVRWLLVLRGLGGFFGVFGLYFSLLYLPLSEATVLTFLGPILTCYVCSLVLSGESFTKQQQLAAFVSLAGVILIARPHSLIALFFSDDGSSAAAEHSSSASNTTQFSSSVNSTILPASADQHHHPGTPAPPTASQHLSAIGISLIGVLGSTCAMTSIRAIGTRAHPFISINYFSVWCTIVSLASLIIFPDVKFRLPGNFTEWGLLASLGACGFVMQWLLTEGLSYGSASNAKAPDVVVGAGEREGDVEAAGAAETTKVAGGRGRDGNPNRGRSVTASKNRVIKGAGTRATSMVYTQMLFALAGDKVVFGVVPTALSWLGSGLILAGAVWVAAARDQPSEKSDVLETGQRRRRRQSFIGGGGMELNTVAANAVGFGGVDARPQTIRDLDNSTQEEVGLMDDTDQSGSDHDEAASPSSSSGSGGRSRSHDPRAS